MMYKLILFLHILFASIWCGGYLIFSIVYLSQALKKKDADIIRSFEDSFGRFGLIALVLQLITGFYLSFRYIPNIFDWFSFTYFVPVNITLKLILILITLFLVHYLKLVIFPKMSNDKMKAAAFNIILTAVIAVGLVLIGTSFRFGGF
jgi:putative copper export protein